MQNAWFSGTDPCNYHFIILGWTKQFFSIYEVSASFRKLELGAIEESEWSLLWFPILKHPRIVGERNSYSPNHSRGLNMVSNKTEAEAQFCVCREAIILIGPKDRRCTAKPRTIRKENLSAFENRLIRINHSMRALKRTASMSHPPWSQQEQGKAQFGKVGKKGNLLRKQTGQASIWMKHLFPKQIKCLNYFSNYTLVIGFWTRA